MKWRMSLCLQLILVSAHLAAAALQGGQFVSENGQYSADLSQTPENDLLVRVFRNSQDIRSIVWSRPIDWKEPYPGWNSPVIQDVKALVSNDGETVVLRDQGAPEAINGVKILGHSSTNDHSVQIFERGELTGAKPREWFPPAEASTQGMRMGVSYYHLGAVIDFIFNERKSYAIWFGQTDQWLLISLVDFKTTLVRDSDTLNRLNEVARRKAEDLVLEHQPPPLRKIAAVVKEQIAKIAPSFGSAPGPRYMASDTAAAYLFLTARGKSADRHYIEGLLNFRPDGVQRTHWMNDEKLEIFYSVTQSERLIGDFLWSRWNGDTNREYLPRGTYLLIPQDSQQFLGSINLNFQLPMRLPSTNSGLLWAYLIPAAEPLEQWDKSSDLITFTSFLRYHSPERPTLVGPEGRAVFRGVTPGEYRIKLIWERNPPAMSFWRTNSYKALPGDYESGVTKPIAVKAGEISGLVSLVCTNRIGGKGSYAADEEWMRNGEQ